MKTRIRLFSLLLVFSLLLGLAPLTAMAATGGYKEEELPIPDGYISFTAPVAAPGGGYATAAKRSDTGAWELLTFASLTGGPSALPLDAITGEIESISMAPDGQLMALGHDLSKKNVDAVPELPEMDAQGAQSSAGNAGAAAPGGQAVAQQTFSKGSSIKNTIVWFDQGGKAAAQFEVQGMLLTTVALSGRRMATFDLGSGVTVYDASGKVISTIPQNDIIGLAAAADGLYLMKRDAIEQLDAQFNTIRSLPFASKFSNQMAVLSDGTLYVLSSEGIFSAGAQDAELTKKTDATRFLLGAPDNGLSGACALADGTLIAKFGGSAITVSSGGSSSVKIGRAGMGGDESRMVAYLYDATIDTSSATDFTISALRDNDILRKVVNDFQRGHPELTVHFDPFLAQDDMDTPVDDAIRTLNTNLLAGKAGDVLMLDELPIAQYINKGVLSPLDDVLKDIGFLPGILNGSRAKDGHIYAMPALFTFDTLWGAKDRIADISTLDALNGLPLENAQELMYPRTPEELLKLFFPAAQASFVDENGKIQFETPAFASFLEALYQIYSNQSSAPDAPVNPALLRKMPMRPEEMQGMLNNAIAVAPAQISSTMTTALPYTVSGGENSLCIPMPSLTGSSDYYVPSLLAGINAQTKQRGLAEEFLLLLYAPGVQELDQVSGLPTVTASLDVLVQKAKELSKNKNVSFMVSTGSGNPIEMKQPDEATWDRLRAMCDTLKTPYIADAQLLSFMAEETASFFNGQGTAQDAARAIAERASAYLNEQ